MKWTLLALLAVAHCAIAQDRLRIEVLPVYVVPSNPQAGMGDSRMHAMRAYIQAGVVANHALEKTREAMELLEILPNKYDLSLASTYRDGEYIESLVIECTMATSSADTTCHGPTGESLNFDELPYSLGLDKLSTDPGTLRLPGTVLLLVIEKSRHFPWSHLVLGEAVVVTWNSWDPQVMHWTTSACTVWAHNDEAVIAHELGHCFGAGSQRGRRSQLRRCRRHG